ncbi:hypothetical protein [Oryzomonas rubra]|uniref:Uncharacterized protein n=1 Tax=Oryzomonas rubra TaxID=2509454 RepID=A0A5A9X6T8_9BACT|nr:hypothetical protein [Oryzomonas rubra]KAA0888085.1 hypothetical protein ET418_16935 [Oryzomonas rubra]
MKTLFLTVLIALISAPALAQLQVFANNLEMKNTTKSIAITEKTPRVIPLKNTDDGSGDVIIKITAMSATSTPEPQNADCSTSLRVFPRVLTIKEGEERIVKILASGSGACRLAFETSYFPPTPKRPVHVSIHAIIDVEDTALAAAISHQAGAIIPVYVNKQPQKETTETFRIFLAPPR